MKCCSIEGECPPQGGCTQYVCQDKEKAEEAFKIYCKHCISCRYLEPNYKDNYNYCIAQRKVINTTDACDSWKAKSGIEGTLEGAFYAVASNGITVVKEITKE